MINPGDMKKRRELVFASEPPDQASKAYQLLTGLENCKVERSEKPHTLYICYSLEDYTLLGFERALAAQGFVLDHNILHSISRQVIHYCENTELHNMDVPDHPTKKREKEIFIKAYDQHLHGDHDETTPPEQRRYK